jgi:hypothetical protein
MAKLFDLVMRLQGERRIVWITAEEAGAEALQSKGAPEGEVKWRN